MESRWQHPEKRTTARNTTRRAARTAPRPTDPTSRVTESEIARRAFDLYCARGGQHGRDIEDWLQAERELRRAEDA